MTRPIGYYVHHQGEGHRRRALAIAEQASGRIVLLGTGLGGRCGAAEIVDLPDDRMDGEAFGGRDGVARPSALHYAPLDHEGVRRRTARIAQWIARARPALLVVDVSVEVAMLARLTSTPTVYVRLSGERWDRAHLEAYRGATALLSPFHEALDNDDTPPAIRRKTFYAAGLTPPVPARASRGEDVLGVIGAGGGLDDPEAWAAAARAVPNMRWRVVGRCAPAADPPPNLDWLGWVEDVEALIAEAAVVVGAAGDGVVQAAIAAGRPFVCIPQDRPYREQCCKAARLAALGAAVVRPAWPQPSEWPEVLALARNLDPTAIRSLAVADGARRAADWLAEVAEVAGRAVGREP